MPDSFKDNTNKSSHTLNAYSLLKNSDITTVIYSRRIRIKMLLLV